MTPRLSVQLAGANQYLLRWNESGAALIERSRQQEAGYTSLASGVTTGQYLDSPPGRRSALHTWFYRVKVGGLTLGPAQLTADPDPGALHVQNVYRRHLQRVGQAAYLIPEQEHGTRCPDCWDATRQVRTRTQCVTCDGSGFVGGWADPIAFNFSVAPEQPEPTPTQTGKLVDNQIQMWTGVYPYIAIGDFVVRARDRRVYTVIRRQPTQKGPHVLRQNVIIRLVDKGAAANELAAFIP